MAHPKSKNHDKMADSQKEAHLNKKDAKKEMHHDKNKHPLKKK
jgi:hypothetical protein